MVFKLVYIKIYNNLLQSLFAAIYTVYKCVQFSPAESDPFKKKWYLETVKLWLLKLAIVK